VEVVIDRVVNQMREIVDRELRRVAGT